MIIKGFLFQNLIDEVKKVLLILENLKREQIYLIFGNQKHINAYLYRITRSYDPILPISILPPQRS